MGPPTALSFEEAGAFPVAVETATRILAQVGVKPGETLLVNGAGGGHRLGGAPVRASPGIRVIGTASAPKHGYLRGLGAIHTTYGPGLIEPVRTLAPDGAQRRSTWLARASSPR